MKKLRVGVIYGGRSGEHEVSLASAASVFQNLDPERYEAIAIRIEKDGRWTLPPEPPRTMKAADVSCGAADGSTHRPSLLIRIGIASYRSGSRFWNTAAAEASDTSCSPERPP